jgi:hypothetical protein
MPPTLTASPIANQALMIQLLGWIAARPRTYGETMEAWRTSCPRLSIWEDCVDDGLVAVSSVTGAGMSGSSVTVTPRGRVALADAD